MEPRLFVATKAFITYNGKVLILRESSKYEDGSKSGKYDIPGGRVTPGESFDQSLLREIKEEAGISVEIGKSFFVNESWPVVKEEQWQIIRIFFECSTDSAKIVLSEDHDDYQWIDPKEYKKCELLIDNLHPAFESYLDLGTE